MPDFVTLSCPTCGQTLRITDEIDRFFTDAEDIRFAKRLQKHHEHLLRVLDGDELDATDNLAERQL